MNVKYINDTGSRHEWRCVHCESDYVVTFHYLDEAWSVQRIRDDGQREILDRNEAQELLGMFPREKALSLTQAATTADSEKEHGPLKGRERLGLDSTTRSEAEVTSGPDAQNPVA